MDCNTSLEDAMDEVQAMSTALCFLCHINADYTEVERFLLRYPEALLFEEAHNETENPRFILERQMQNCQCFIPACNDNRRKILKVLKRGFEYYRGMARNDFFDQDITFRLDRKSTKSASHWHFYAEKLRMLERDIREIKLQDLAIRNRIVETSEDVKNFKYELEGVSRQEGKSKSPISLLMCHRSSEIFARRSMLEYQLGIATLNMSTLEKEQELIGQERIAARRMQLALLKTAFGGCRRHMCEATRKEPM